MPSKLTEWDLRTIAEVTSEMAKFRGAGFDAHAQALAFVRAAQVDADFRARLEEAARRIEARRSMNLPRKLFVPIASLFRDLERDAEAVLSGWKRGSSVATYRCVMVGVDDKVESVSEITALTQSGAIRKARSIFRAAAPRRVNLELWRDDKLIARIRPEKPKTKHRSF